MFTRISLVFASLIAATALAAACPPPSMPSEELPPLIPPGERPPKKPVPASQFPHVGTIIALDGKEGAIEYTVVVPVRVQKLIRDEPPGRRPGSLISVWSWEYRQITRKAKLDRLQITDATGKRVTTDEVWKRLRIGSTFFVSADGNPVSAAHLKMIAPDVLVVVDHDNVLLERILEHMQLAGDERVPERGPQLR